MKDKDLEQALKEYAAGKGLSQIAAEMAPASERELLRRCATVRSFDRALFEDLLRPLPAETKGDDLFERVVDNPVVQRVPRPKGTYRIAQEDRPRVLGNWEGSDTTPSLRSLRDKLLLRYQKGPYANPVEALYQRAWLNPKKAEEEFETLFTAAEARSDLRLCDELIGLFAEPPQVSEPFRLLLDAHQARVNARALWADELYRTGSFLDRPALAEQFEHLMKSTDPECWVYQIHAASGTGKTMFVRWALARWCVPNGVPCARIDFDHADATLLASHPERLALEIARAWNQQLPGKPLAPLIGRLSASDAAATATQSIAQLAASLTLPDGVNALIVLDTVEEVLIPLPDRLYEILGHIAELHAKSPGKRVRLMISGRYDLRERADEGSLRGLLGAAPIHEEVTRFTDSEARDYLVRLRGLPADDPVEGRITAVIQRAEGNPLKLWLFTEILNGEPELTAEAIHSNLSVEVEYLIRRIVLRIGESARDPRTGEIPDIYKGVRWVLRYGVVPRQLTLDFLQAGPIRDRLLREITGREPRDEPSKGTETLDVKEEVFPRAASEPRIEDLWHEIRKYAGTSSWVDAPSVAPGEPELLVFTPDVLYPMRALLLKQEPVLFVALHTEAMTYFQARAASLPPGAPERFRCLREVVYHDFQRQGELAGAAWKALLRSDEFRDSPEWRRNLADDVTSRGFFKDDDPSEPATRNNVSKKMISAADLALAYFVKARAYADLAAANPSAASTPWKNALYAFGLYRKTSEKLATRAAEPGREEETLLEGLIQAHAPGGNRDAALAAFRLLHEAADPRIHTQALREEASLLAISFDPRAQDLLSRLIDGQADPKMLRDTIEMLDMLARQQLAFDRLAEALASCDRAIGYARDIGPSAKNLEARADLLGREVLLRSGCPEGVFAKHSLPTGGVASPGPEPATWRNAAWFLKAEARLAQLDPKLALDLHREARELRRKGVRAKAEQLELLPEKPAEREQRARIASALMDYRRASDELSRAGSEWLELTVPETAQRADGDLASLADLYVHRLHDLAGAAGILGRSTAATDPAGSEPLLRIELLRAELKDVKEEHEEARAAVDGLLDQCRVSPPRFRVLAAMTGLSFVHAPAEPYLAHLADALTDVTPPTARLALLRPLERCPDRDNLPKALVDRFLALLPNLADDSLAAPDRAVLGLRLSDACRVFGRHELALAALSQARKDFDAAVQARNAARWRPFALLEVLRSQDRLGIGASAVQEARQVLTELASQYKGEPDLVLLATAWVEQAERAWQAGDAKALNEAVNEGKRLCENTRPPGMIWVASRLFRVRARLAGQSGFDDDHVQFDTTARKYEESLGLPASAPLEHGSTEPPSPSSGPPSPPSDDLKNPLLPVHPACTLTLDWNTKEGISVTAESLPSDPRKRVLGFSFIDWLGLGRTPTAAEAIASVPIRPLTMLQQDWAAVARQMTDLLLGPDALREIGAAGGGAGKQADVRLRVNDAVLSQLPWELVQQGPNGQGFLAASPLVRYLYRSAEISGGDRVTMRWVQYVLRQMFDRNLRVDGVDSQRLRDVIRSFQDRERLAATGWADARTRWALDRAWRAEQGRLVGSVLLITGSQPGSSAHGARAVRRMASIYTELGHMTQVLSQGTSELAELRLAYQEMQLSVIHVEAPFDVTSAVGIRIDLGETGGAPEKIAFTPRRLNEFLKALPESDSKPLIVLDPPMPRSPFEAVFQLLMRNAFAAELYRLGNAPVVLATGFVPAGASEGLQRDLIHAGSMGATIGELLAMIRGSHADASQRSLPIEELLFPASTALFAHDPDTRLPGEFMPATTEVSPGALATPGATTGFVTRTVYALLVAIDKYPAAFLALAGCVNDVTLFSEFLADRIGRSQGVGVELKVLKDGEATRAAIIDGFRSHLARAGKGDVALFYFCGRGSQQRSAEEFWDLEPDRLDETLVCVDSRQEGNWDLADKELFKLVKEVATRGPHVALILDCCHSGSGTREVSYVGRRAPTDLRLRPVVTYLVSRDELEAGKAEPGSGTSWLHTTQVRHVLLRACRDDEEAFELVVDGAHRGVFSLCLLDALKGAAGVPTYRDLFARTAALVGARTRGQSPQIEGTNDDLDAVFLAGAIQPAPFVFQVTSVSGQWTLHAGATHGIPAPYGADTARVALFAFDAPAGDLRDPSRAVANARVVEVLPASSRLEIEGGAALTSALTYKAVVISMPVPFLPVAIDGENEVRDRFRKALATSGPGGGPPFYIRIAGNDEPPEFRVVARGGRFDITRPGDDRNLVAPRDGQGEDAVRLTVQRLDHMARWIQTARLGNPRSSIQPGDVKITILVDGKEVAGRAIRLEFRQRGGDWVAPEFQLNVTNASQRVLCCALLDLTQDYGIYTRLLGEGVARLEPGQTAWAADGTPLTATIPEELWRQGVIEFQDILKLIASTQEFDPHLLEQPPLERRTTPRSRFASRALSGTLTLQLRQVGSRDLVPDQEAESIDDWQTVDIAFTTVRPLPQVAVPGAGDSVSMTGGLTLHGHSSLKANARLSTEALVTRDLGSHPLPRLLSEDPSVCVPLTCAGPLGINPGLSVLELTDVHDPAAVTPHDPLLLTVPVALAVNEHVVAVAYDGEFFLPVGRASARTGSETTIAIDRLPQPLADGRSLSGAVKVLLEKVTDRWAEPGVMSPRLAAVLFPPDGGALVRVADAGEVRNRIAAAGQVLLLVHGVLGETGSMSEGVRLARVDDGRPLTGLYDVVLTFDYDGATTGIVENARALGSALEAAGLGAGHAKTLDVVAHSSGGLVLRWFIERERGNQVVRKLVMVGTPNGGSPWVRTADWARVALGLGLNQLTVVTWPASVAGTLAALAEAPPSARAETAPGADLIKQLAESPDPAVPYVLLAGMASVVTGTAGSTSAKSSPFARLLARITLSSTPQAVVAPFFLEEANDLAVSVTSMRSLPPGRAHPVEIRTVPCDHLGYFNEPAALKALVNALHSSSGTPRP